MTAIRTTTADDTSAPIGENVGKQVSNWELQDPRGRNWTLKDFDEQELIVVAFLGTECPLAKLYGHRLLELANEFGPLKVGFVGVDANRQDSLEEISSYSKALQLTFPMLKDPGNKLADALGAERTPEVFVLDRNRTVRYRGRVDDQYGIGFTRKAPERNDLKMALRELLEGKPVTQPQTEATGCIIGRQKVSNDHSDITYASHVAAILQTHCLQCHREGNIGPFAMDDYQKVAGWADMIAEVVREERMPPWHAKESLVPLANDRRLTDEEKRTIEMWAKAGAPEGDALRVRSPQTFVEGWRLPREPDLVLQMAATPEKIPAEGALRYRYFEVETGLTEDRWIEAVEVQPGNRAIVHHILVFDTTENSKKAERDFQGGVRGFFAGYVPGSSAETFPPGMAKFLPAGSKFIFQVHYTPNGTDQEDNSRIGLVFADPSKIHHEVETRSAFQLGIRIPRGAPNHEESSRTRLLEPVQLLGMSPHMHVRGKSFLYLMKRPGDADWVTLLDVPEYDFNWQTSYRLQDAIELPAGTAIKCVAHYDNSDKNPNNPNPKEDVRWGEQTWEEMMIGYFDVAFPVDPAHRQKRSRSSADQRIEEFVMQFDKNDDFQLQLDEVPMKMRIGAVAADRDRDGILSPEEIKKTFNR